MNNMVKHVTKLSEEWLRMWVIINSFLVLRATQHDVESSSTCIITRTNLPLIFNYMLMSMLWVCQRDLINQNASVILIIC